MNNYNRSNNQRHVAYNDKKEINELDLNIWENSNTDFIGGHLYEKQAMSGAKYLCSPQRNLENHYIYGVERMDHPDHASRFGYANFPNGYGVGVWSSGFYNNPPACQFDPQPPNMAPERFYTPLYQGRNRVDTQATKDWNDWSHTFVEKDVY